MKEWARWFYLSDTWRQTRAAYLAAQGYECERCKAAGIVGSVAKIVHHKTHLTPENINDPFISLAWENLEATCHDCHTKGHLKKSRAKKYKFDAQGNILKA